MQQKLTPMFRQYLEIKKKYQSEILFFRMGDFYEMFFEDAHTAAAILDIALTKRQNDIPMCGVPFHAAESYITRLIKAGHRVAICEQLESTPSQGNIVKRDVVRVITPGTVIEPNMLQSDENNYLGSVVMCEESIGLAFVDVSTGDLYVAEIERSFDIFKGLIARFNPAEVIIKDSENAEDEKFLSHLSLLGISENRINEWLYDKEYMENTVKDIFALANASGVGLDTQVKLYVCGSILEYIRDTHKKSVDYLKLPRFINTSGHMQLDDSTIHNLELITNSFDRSRQKTLFSVLNQTKCAMGKRLLERNILEPLTDITEIEERLDAVQYFTQYRDMAETLKEKLKSVHDIERLMSRFSIGRVFPKDYLSLRDTAEACLAIKELMSSHEESPLYTLISKLPSLQKLQSQIASSITEEPALTPEQGRIIAEGKNSELDRLYAIKQDSKTWILEYQEEERQKHDIATLKIKYNKVHGYYIEISKGAANKAPAEYLRKQTLVNAERFTTEKLQGFETDILQASDIIVEIEHEEIAKLHALVLSFKEDLQKTAAIVAEIDFYQALAEVAVCENLIRPEMSSKRVTEIRDGRHIVVEKYFTKEVFIPNDILFDGSEQTIKLITGPNMSGKSTYMRMAALIQLMAQIGSFVPASKAVLSIVDRIFTRIGASDNISRGESTFLVEMNETATILNNATDKSLIIMDEVGRGTSTYDGLSLAYAIVDYIARYVKARTLFATHYHELTELEDTKGVVNYNVLVKETRMSVEFLHKVARGAADRSYGIHVAKLAGIPHEITKKAESILAKLEKKKRDLGTKRKANTEENEQVELFNAANHLVVKAIKSIDVESITPLEALNEINRLKSLIDQ